MANDYDYINRYKREHCISLRFELNRKYDSDIIEYLSKYPKKTTRVKELIREEIRRENNK